MTVDKAALPAFSDLRPTFTRRWVCVLFRRRPDRVAACSPHAPHDDEFGQCGFRWESSIGDRNAVRFGLGRDNTDGPVPE